MKRMILFCGVGGTGKTTVLDALRESNDPNLYGCMFVGSVVRDYYKANNVSSETTVSSLPPEKRTAFQVGLFDFYIAEMQKVLDANPDKIIVSDRSLVDHYAYTLLDSELDQNQFESILEKLRAFMENVYIVIKFPLMTFDSGDKFRNNSFSRRVALDALMDRAFQHLTVYEPLIIRTYEIDVSGRATEVIKYVRECKEYIGRTPS